MTLKEELRQLGKNLMQDARLLYEKVKQYPLISLFFIITVFLLIAIPHWQVSGINNATEKDTHENQARATLAQIFGGAAIGIGLYYTWRRITIAEEDLKATQKNLEIAQEGQITERFTRAVEQLGNPAMEIRLGGIYALERIANESDRDYWPIMEILTAYVREKSPEETIERIKITYSPLKFLVNDNEKKEKLEVTKMPLDIQAILTVIGRRKYSSNSSETKSLDLSKTNLRRCDFIGANLEEANLKRANLQEAHLEEANLIGANLQEANFQGAVLVRVNLHEANINLAKFQHAILMEAILTNANLQGANLEHALLSMANLENADFGVDENFNSPFWGEDFPKGANLENAHLKYANLRAANLQMANFKKVDLEGANLEGANLIGTNLEGANLKGAKNLTIDQLSKAKTLYKAQLDAKLEDELKAKYPHLFDEPKDKA